MSAKYKHKHAPKGYRIVRWLDGFYHVYAPSGSCLDEVLDRQEAVECAWDHASKGAAKPSEAKAVQP